MRSIAQSRSLDWQERGQGLVSPHGLDRCLSAESHDGVRRSMLSESVGAVHLGRYSGLNVEVELRVSCHDDHANSKRIPVGTC